MATYTDNYNLIKPTYAETADIVPLNNNFEKIDEVMHASQTSLAPAYDQTASYQPGNVVMHELNMYKCTGATSGAWDPSKWTRTTAAETGGGGSVDFDIFGEGSGSVVTITDGAEAGLAECIVEIEATQSGSGTPSPSNVRPIVGRSEVNITVSDGENDNVTTIPLDRTVYGGTLDVTRGELTDTVGDLISFSSANTNVWSGVVTSPQGVTRFYTTPSYAGRTLLQADSYELSPNYNTQTDIITTSADGRIIITPTFGQGKTLEEFKALLATYPFNIKMTLATPQTYTLTPEEVSTILGYNNISADSGEVSVVYVKQTAPIKPNPTGADIPLKGIEIDGEKFSIPSGEMEIISITAGDGTTVRTFTFSKTPKFIKIYWEDTVLDGGWIADFEIVWGQPFVDYKAHARYVSYTGLAGGCASIVYPSDNKSMILTGGNAFGACNSTNGSGLIYVQY